MRRSGILLPISSLPSKYGIGTFSKEAFEFVDFLANAGQTYWQVLPLGNTLSVLPHLICRTILGDSIYYCVHFTYSLIEA